MSAHHPSVYQALECFGVGLLVIAGVAVLFLLLVLVGNRIEGPVDVWLMRHPLANKAIRIGAWIAAVSIVCVAIFAMGCSIMEGM